MMVINTSARVLGASGMLGRARENLTESLARLTSNSRRAASDKGAPEQARSRVFEAEITRAKEANANIENALSHSRTQDQFLEHVQTALERLSEISLQAQSANHGGVDATKYASEFNHLKEYISDITNKTFNGINLFGSEGLSLRFHDDSVNLQLAGADLAGPTSKGVLNAYSGTSVSSRTAAISALNNLKTAIQALANMRARVGANLQRLNMTNEQLNILSENLSAVNGQTGDVRAARETVSKATANILAQTGASMVAKANALPKSALHI
ncbi:MAG: flagellin [Verrucomicrobia bacterium]|nr:flagellin [Verrucomicrobiota bacterium]